MCLKSQPCVYTALFSLNRHLSYSHWYIMAMMPSPVSNFWLLIHSQATSKEQGRHWHTNLVLNFGTADKYYIANGTYWIEEVGR